MEVKTPQGELYILKVPEKYLLMNKTHTLEINIKNSTHNSDEPTEFYLKYRANGCKLVNIPSNLDNNVRFSMSPGQDFTFQIELMPTIEGPLQLEIQFVGIQKEFAIGKGHPVCIRSGNDQYRVGRHGWGYREHQIF